MGRNYTSSNIHPSKQDYTYNNNNHKRKPDNTCTMCNNNRSRWDNHKLVYIPNIGHYHNQWWKRNS